ncbi:hypothetical protein SAY87_008148 [Trapa incisa]|uniref:Protein kinase domain-containing protein n=1 Tax=Trapa incisa TaxID=236973 RepID=A0AAN7KM27_9MYRT|nr:hypothetical protein SAY87_008148 [Trapa incisa]
MGCLHSKASAVDDSRDSPKGRMSPSSSKRSSGVRDLNPRLGSSRRNGGFGGKVKSRDVSLILVDEKEATGSGPVYDGDSEIERKISEIEKQRKERAESLAADKNHVLVIGQVPKAAEGEQVAAGWPSWLSAVAGEAINGWLPRRADTFEKLDKIGQGTYSSVYRARDVISNKMVAIKRVRFDNLDPESVRFMCREILILRRLDHQNIIKLEGLITSRMSCSLYLIFEYMEHDLTGLAARPGVKFTESQIKCYMQQLLSGLDHCHSRGVLHRDIKGSNLLIDNNGILKIADFGLASFFDPGQSAPQTSRVVTLWYRPPELLLGASHYGDEVDLWSTGCILGELYTRNPILPGKTEVEQLHKIFRLCGSPSDDYWKKLHLPHAAVFMPPRHYRRCIKDTFKELPPAAVGLMEELLSVDPWRRGTASLALSNEFFRTSPVACDPSSLPKYPPSKEIDAKLREEEARRKGTAGEKNAEKKLPRDFRSKAPYNSNPDQTRQSHSISRSQGGNFFSTQQEKTISGFMVGPIREPRGLRESRKGHGEQYPDQDSYSSPLAPGYGICKVLKEVDHSVASIAGEAGQESSNSASGSISSMRALVRRQDNKYPSGQHSLEDGWDKMYLSGPLLVPSNNVEKILRDHERRFQAFTRRIRFDKSRINRDQKAHQHASMQVAV